MKLLGRVDNVYYLELDKQIIHYNKYYLKGRSLVMKFRLIIDIILTAGLRLYTRFLFLLAPLN